MADHDDYLPGEAPSAHHGSHEDGGTDEISIQGLAGDSSELVLHKADASAHHVKYTNAEARAANFVISAILGTQ